MRRNASTTGRSTSRPAGPRRALTAATGLAATLALGGCTIDPATARLLEQLFPGTDRAALTEAADAAVEAMLRAAPTPVPSGNGGGAVPTEFPVDRAAETSDAGGADGENEGENEGGGESASEQAPVDVPEAQEGVADGEPPAEDAAAEDVAADDVAADDALSHAAASDGDGADAEAAAPPAAEASAAAAEPCDDETLEAKQEKAEKQEEKQEEKQKKKHDKRQTKAGLVREHVADDAAASSPVSDRSNRDVARAWASTRPGAKQPPSPAVDTVPPGAPAPENGTPPAAAPEAMAVQFFDLINAERAAVGLPALSADGSLNASALAQAGRIQANGGLFHQDLRPLLGLGFRTAGENVGVGPEVGVLHEAFVASPGHYANIVNPSFTSLGIGVVVETDGTIWVAMVFGG